MIATVYIATSLDGFIAREDGGIDWLETAGPVEGEDFGWSEFFPTVDAIVMGRRTFETALGFGPDAWLYGSTPLVVLSTTLKTLPEGVRATVELSSLAPRALLQQLAERGCKRVYVDGGKTVQSFLREDLVDELVVTRIPVLIGKGLPLFGPLERDLAWEHVATKVFANGLVKSSYRRKR
jgi:dihydrofolate reductase